MESKEYYQSLLAVVEFILNGNDDIIEKRGTLLAGAYWHRISRYIAGLNAGFVMPDNSIHITDRGCLKSVREDCIHAIKRIDSQDADRKIDNDTKILNTKFARIALFIEMEAIKKAIVAVIKGLSVQSISLACSFFVLNHCLTFCKIFISILF